MYLLCIILLTLVSQGLTAAVNHAARDNNKFFSYLGFDENKSEDHKLITAYEKAWKGSLELINTLSDDDTLESSLFEHYFLGDNDHIYVKFVLTRMHNLVESPPSTNQPKLHVMKNDWKGKCSSRSLEQCYSANVHSKEHTDQGLGVAIGDMLLHCCFEDGKVFQQLDSITCDSLGNEVSRKMLSFSDALVHEFVHWDQVGPFGLKHADQFVMANGLESMGDTSILSGNAEKYGYMAAMSIAGALCGTEALRNPDSYAWAATIRYFQQKCSVSKFDFSPPTDVTIPQVEL